MELEACMASLQLSQSPLNASEEKCCDFAEKPTKELSNKQHKMQLRSDSLWLTENCTLVSLQSPDKRRVINKPKKVLDIENYYLDKRVKKLHTKLPTIYENNSDKPFSNIEIQRAIKFNNVTVKNSGKVKRRRQRIKRIFMSTKLPNKLNITPQYLMEKLADIEAD